MRIFKYAIDAFRLAGLRRELSALSMELDDISAIGEAMVGMAPADQVAALRTRCDVARAEVASAMSRVNRMRGPVQ